MRWQSLTVTLLMLAAFSVNSAFQPDHPHLQRLLDNAYQYVNPAHGLIDPASGYPVEGWNQVPEQGLFLRSFTQLTAIGAWVELLANVVSGAAPNPFISKDDALRGLSLAVTSLLADQQNPALAAKGLLVNFLGLEGGQRLGPLLESIEKSQFNETFGAENGAAIWQALVEQGWIQEEDQGRKGRILRRSNYGSTHFDGALAAYAEAPLRSRIMGLLDQRAVTIIFGDNANLSAALARSVGALLTPEIRDEPQVVALREQIERFIAAQQPGYAHLFDPKTGTFVFGWEVTADRFVGWDDGQGHWVTGQMNYLINEFRGPWTFVVLRHGLPIAALRNAGFKIKPYRQQDGRDRYALAAWDGSAFQLLGLSLFMQELENPGWRQSLATLLDIELDFSTQHHLPGFLSEAYSGNGTEYTGWIGIPELAVTDTPLITQAPSIYTLGVASMIAPAKLDVFLAGHWPLIAGLFTEHGPWEGWDMAADKVIPYQTTTHTLSLILGGIGTAPENMRRYLAAHQLLDALVALYAPGDHVDFLDSRNAVRGFADQGQPKFSCEQAHCRLASSLSASSGMTFSVPQKDGVSLSNGRLLIRYHSATPIPDASIAFKRAEDDALPAPGIPVEIFMRFRQTAEDQIEIVLPATPALRGIRELSLRFQRHGTPKPLDVSITTFEFIPFAAALDVR